MDLQRLAAGTSGQVLQTGGTGANPSWGTVGGASNAFMAHTKSNATSGDVVYTTELFDDGGNYNIQMVDTLLQVQVNIFLSQVFM